MQLFQNKIEPSFPLKYVFVTAIYFILSYIGILHHEIWLDEMHHFLLARDSGSLNELYNNARYDGHPLLWNILLMIITRFSHNPFYMQLLHIIISTGAVIVFLRNAPFTDFFKVLFVFGYYMMYEYNVISRNYSISLLFLFLFCSLFNNRKKNYFYLFITLAILANTHLFSLFAAISLAGITVIDLFLNRNEYTNTERKTFFYSSLILVLAIGLSIFQIIPPHDHFLYSYDVDPYLSFKRIGKAMSVVFKGFIHLQNLSEYHFWNTNLFVAHSKIISAFISAVFIVIPFFILKDTWPSLIFFYLTAAAIIIFIYFSPIIVAVRHCGFIFITFIIALWLSTDVSQKHFLFQWKTFLKTKRFVDQLTIPFIYAVLITQVMGAGIAYSFDLLRPFSEGKTVANYLKQKNLSDKTIAVSNQSAGPAISGYLDKKFFYPETNQFGSFCKWNTIPFVIDKSTILTRIKQLDDKNFILVLNEPFIYPDTQILGTPVFRDKGMNIIYLTKFDKGIVRSENYWIYEVKKL